MAKKREGGREKYPEDSGTTIFQFQMQHLDIFFPPKKCKEQRQD